MDGALYICLWYMRRHDGPLHNTSSTIATTNTRMKSLLEQATVPAAVYTKLARMCTHAYVGVVGQSRQT